MNKGACSGVVDIGEKENTVRQAVAVGEIILTARAYKALLANQSPKGNVFEVAKVAGVLAAKATPQIIPFCHPLNLEKVSVVFEPNKSKHLIRVTSQVKCFGKTGVEMEALAAVSVACLTIYDMMKWSGQDMRITNVHLIHKSGGKSGVYQK